MTYINGQERKDTINSDTTYLEVVLTPAVVDNVANRNTGSAMSTRGMTQSVLSPTVSYTTSLPVLNLSRSPLSSYAVGEIPMTTDIAQNGAVTASVPIEVLPGVGGVQPQLALTYSSQSGNGIGGYGWHLSGISAITRRGANFTQDNVVLPANQSNDYFMLDGARLTLIESSGSVKTYSLEGSRFGTIAKFYNSPSNPYWEVKYANGVVGEYRKSLNNTVWYVTLQKDRFGNKIEYSYYHYLCTPCGSNYVDIPIQAIYYGGNTSQGTYNFRTITFEYEDRADRSRSFYAGTNLAHSKRLKSINTGIKNYTLTYENSYYSMLKRIACTSNFDGKTAQLSPLDFSYGIGTENTSSTTGRTTAGMVVEQTSMPFGYFTDGNWDNILATTGQFSLYENEEGVVSFPKKNFYQWGKVKGDNYETMHSMYHPDDAIFFAPTFSDASNYGIRTFRAEEGFRGMVTLDTDMFAETQEVVLINATGTYSGTQNIKFRIIEYAGLANYGVRTINFQLPSSTSYNGYYSVTPMNYTAGDITGKGKQVVIGVQKYSRGNSYIFTSGLYVFDIHNSSCSSIFLPSTFETDDEVIIADYDGNGTSDLFHLHSSGMTVYRFVEVGSSVYALQEIASTTQFNRDKREREETQKYGFLNLKKWDHKQKLLLGDINGDGKLDLLTTPMIGWKDGSLQTRYGNVWTQCLSTGTSFEVSTYEVNGLPDIYRDVLLHDFNGDGKSDVVNIEGGSMKVWYSDGDKIAYNKKENYNKPAGFDYEGKLFTIDAKNSNHNRVIGYIRNNQLAKLSIRNNETTNTFLSSVTDSKNVVTKFTYGRIDANNGNLYTQGYVNQFPYLSYSGYYWVGHTHRKTASGINPSVPLLDLTYSYQNAVIHRQGLGFCGFEKVSVYDNVGQNNSTVTYNPLNYGVVMKQQDKTSEITFEYFPTELYGNNEPNIRLKKQTAKNLQTGTIVTTENKIFDVYGNVTSSTTSYGNDLVENKTNTFINYKGTEYHLIGLPESAKTTTVRGGNSVVQDVNISYNAKHLPQTTISKVNGNEIGRKNAEYDNFSNLTKEETTPYGQAELKTTVQAKYSSNGAYLEWSENSMGQRTTYSNYVNQYLPKSAKDFKHRETTTEYTALVQPTRINYPDGVEENIYSAWGGVGLYDVSKFVTGQPTTIAYYDALGREIRRGHQRFDGTWQYVDKQYDGRGRLWKTSLPFKGGSATHWTTHAYDDYNRPTSVTEASGKTSTWSYSGNRVIQTIDGITSTKQFDAAGQLISVTDPGGTITYALRADGQPSSITAPGGIVTSFTYDNYGRKTSITDPSAGTQGIAQRFEGNQAVTVTTDANGHEVTSKYDKFGRLLVVTRPEMQTDYTYNADGYLTKEVSTNGTEKVFGYDNLGRINYERNSSNFGYSWLDKSYTYSQGLLASKTYSASEQNTIAVENYSYAYGHLNEIKLNGQTSIWKLNGENSLGQPTQVQTGGIARTYQYNAYGLPTRRISGNLQDMSFNFDAVKGNLLSRTDNKRGLTETFSYDNLNRLSGINNQAIQYANNGNITVMPGVGTMEYTHSTKPYAVTGLIQTAGSEMPKTQSGYFNSLQRADNLYTEPMLARYTYNASGERTEMDMSKKGSGNYMYPYTVHRVYLEEYEIHDQNKHILYLGGDAYSAPAVYVKESFDNQWKVYYICRDYLGSITHIANSDGSLKEENSYTAWGRLRSPDTHEVGVSDGENLFLGRGYTGHEHIPYSGGMINMNARVYDPALGRFISPDPYVQMPDFTQNFNRYSYGLNNPLRYTDPDGEFVLTLICVFVPGLQGFIPYAVAADLSWMSEYGAQIINNINVSNQMKQMGLDGLRTGQILFGSIDWFDVGVAGLSGGISAAFPVAAPYLRYGTPILTNAIDIYGDGNVDIVGRKEINEYGNEYVPKSWGMYLADTGLEIGSIALTDVANAAIKSDGFKNKRGNYEFKDIPKKSVKDYTPEDFGYDFMKQFIGNNISYGLKTNYRFDLPYNENPYIVPFLPKNNQFPPFPPFDPHKERYYRKDNKNNPLNDKNSMDLILENLILLKNR